MECRGNIRKIFDGLPFSAFDGKSYCYTNVSLNFENYKLLFDMDIPLKQFSFFKKLQHSSLKSFFNGIKRVTVMSYNCYKVGLVNVVIENQQSDIQIFDLNDFVLICKFFFYIIIALEYDLDFSQESEIITELVNIWESRNFFEFSHSRRVAFYSKTFAEKLKMSKREVNEIYWAALAHDLGKILVPVKILNKPGPLSDSEYRVIKKHSENADVIFFYFNTFSNFMPIIKHHHEKWDGTGYPDHLLKNNIPFYSRIISLADSYDAMTNFRVYKFAKTTLEALKEIREGSGTHFDPDLSREFLKYEKFL